ncbi:MAG: Arc family DNA-binding protein [Bacteroidales bacterium]|nr:Arc family DNA-binding protein [Bacteroidales bacterium]
METVQTTIRLPKELVERVKRQARREHRSFNSYVEHTLDKSTELVFPKLKPEDFIISDEIKNLTAKHYQRPSQEELDADPKLAYLVEKYEL